ncbi:MAG TPA: NAD-dependent epimerase/dehydratase family protein [Terriglobia bacterium]|nr:NAD-dependent epimerase/dehydratase family protein [Terriglobia bacterium]
MVLLTGATGYLGSQIARELVRRGEPFRVLVRDPSRLPFDVAAAGCDVVTGDVCDPDAVARAVRGARFVIHTAALVKMWARRQSDFRRVNVEGLKLLCQAATDAGAERIVYTSSFIALGPSSDANLGEALRHTGPFSNEYEQSKAEALDWLRREGFGRYPVMALVPGVIYGPGPFTEGNLVGGMMYQYCFKIMPAIVGSGKQRWSFAHNADVVAAHLAALEKAEAGQEYVLGGDNRSLNDFYAVLAQISGRRRPVRRLPFRVAKLLGGADVAVSIATGHPPTLTPGVVEIFKHDWVYSSAKAVRELGYRITPLEAGLPDAFNAMMDHVKGTERAKP